MAAFDLLDKLLIFKDCKAVIFNSLCEIFKIDKTKVLEENKMKKVNIKTLKKKNFQKNYY